VGALKKVATQCGSDSVFFSFHSLRIGGATAMACAGSLRERIKRIAAWAESSDCVLIIARLTALDGGTLTAVVEARVSAFASGGSAAIVTSSQVLLLVPLGQSISSAGGVARRADRLLDQLGVAGSVLPVKRRVLPASFTDETVNKKGKSSSASGPSTLAHLGQVQWPENSAG